MIIFDVVCDDIGMLLNAIKCLTKVTEVVFMSPELVSEF